MRFIFILVLASGCATEPVSKAEPQKQETAKMKEETSKTEGKDIGNVAPDFSLPANDGNTYKLSDYRGKKNVVLVFYCMNNTPG